MTLGLRLHSPYIPAFPETDLLESRNEGSNRRFFSCVMGAVDNAETGFSGPDGDVVFDLRREIDIGAAEAGLGSSAIRPRLLATTGQLLDVTERIVGAGSGNGLG